MGAGGGGGGERGEENAEARLVISANRLKKTWRCGERNENRRKEKNEEFTEFQYTRTLNAAVTPSSPGHCQFHWCICTLISAH